MTVVELMSRCISGSGSRKSGGEQRYNPFGQALRRLMAAENVQAESQRDFVEMLSGAGYPIGQQTVSGYMTWRQVDLEDGGVGRVPRSTPSLEFVGALFRIFDSPPEQKDDIIRGWFEVLPPAQRQGMLSVLDYLRESGEVSEALPNAMRHVIDYEQERNNKDSSNRSGKSDKGVGHFRGDQSYGEHGESGKKT